MAIRLVDGVEVVDDDDGWADGRGALAGIRVEARVARAGVLASAICVEDGRLSVAWLDGGDDGCGGVVLMEVEWKGRRVSLS